jgi:hypothetical protein
MSGRSGQSGQVAQQRLEEAVQHLQQALNNMRQAASSQNTGTPQSEAEARRAAERLEEAKNLLRGMQQQRNDGTVEQLAQRAENLARQQEDFSRRMRRSLGSSSLSGREGQQEGAQSGQKESPEKLAQEKEQIAGQTQQMERDLQRAVRDTAGQRDVANKLREALGELQQKEIASQMNRTAQWLRNGMGAYAVMREATATEALNKLADQLKQAQAAMGTGKQGKEGDKQLEQALAQAEQLRQRMQAMSRAMQDKNGKGQQPGQQAWKPGQLQSGREGQQGQGQQAGQQVEQQGNQQGQGQQGGQQGGQQAGGQQAGGQQQGGAQRGGPNNGWGPRGGPGPVGPWGGYWGGRLNTPDDWAGAWRDGVRDLGRLEHELQGNPDLVRDLQNMMRQMQQMDPYQFPNHPELVDQIISKLVGGMEGVELQLRRMTDDKSGGGTVRSGTGETVPPGYADAVAEYFRRLSKK